MGSSIFLKDRFGVGYHMTMVKAAICNSQAVEALVQRFVPQADMVSDVGAELTLLLPKDSCAVFPAMFHALEQQQTALGVDSYGMSMTTMEEVFLKVAVGNMERKTSSSTHPTPRKSLAPPQMSTNLLAAEGGGYEERLVHQGLALRWRQFVAMLTKRYLYALRNKSAIITQLVLPLIFAFAAIAIAR